MISIYQLMLLQKLIVNEIKVISLFTSDSFNIVSYVKTCYLCRNTNRDSIFWTVNLIKIRQ